MPLDFPNSPTNGQIFGAYTWNAARGVWLQTSMSSRVVTTSDTPPAAPANGDMWMYTVDGTCFIYYDDGTSGQWVEQSKSILTPATYQSPNYVINGAFDVWQRGTSVSVTANATYTADRWIVQFNGSGATRTISQQTFTPGAAPVAGYEGTYFLRFAQSVAGSGASFTSIGQRIEDVRTLAGQTVTVSFWAKAASTMTIPNMSLWQNFGTGGSSTVGTDFASSLSIGTSWTRYSYTVTLPSISGKTIGTSSYLHLEMYQPVNQTFTLDLWGVQVESGSVATPFRRNAPSIQAELAACQRYYFKMQADTGDPFCMTFAESTTISRGVVHFPTRMRVAPSALEQTGTAGDYAIIKSGPAAVVCTSVPIYIQAGVDSAIVSWTTGASLVAGDGGYARSGIDNGFLAWSAEL